MPSWSKPAGRLRALWRRATGGPNGTTGDRVAGNRGAGHAHAPADQYTAADQYADA
jgi:hypothetical protein